MSSRNEPGLANQNNRNRLRKQLEQFEHILSIKGQNEQELKTFDVETEALLSEIFGNPSEILEAYAYAQLGEAGAWINLPEEAQLEGEQDVARLSLQQRKGVLEQGLAELEARQTKAGEKR